MAYLPVIERDLATGVPYAPVRKGPRNPMTHYIRHMPALSLALVKRIKCHSNEYALAAATVGNIDVLRHITFDLSDVMCPWAAAHGPLASLQYFRERGAPWSALTCSVAAAGGRLDVLRWAHENGCPWDREYARNVSFNHGHFHIILWIDEHTTPLDDVSTCELAIGP
jgi:hypothetical protein